MNHSKNLKSNISLLILLIFIPLSSIAQNPPCPKKNQKRYKCSLIKEDILSKLENTNYQMPTKFKIKLVSNFTKKKDIEKVNKVVLICHKVLNDPDFWNALENYGSYKYSVWKQKDQSQVVQGVQIINSLINGNPNNSARPAERIISLNLELYGLGFKFPFFEKALAKEIGDGKIYNKKWFFRKYSIAAIGSNWIHEFSHSQGLSHCYYCDKNRDYSIPYVINRIFVEVAKKYQ